MKNLLAGFTLIATLAFAQKVEDKSAEHKTFAGVRELIIDDVTGSIEVTGTTGGAVEMDISKTLSADSQDRVALARREVRLDVVQEGGLVRLMVDADLERLAHSRFRVQS